MNLFLCVRTQRNTFDRPAQRNTLALGMIEASSREWELNQFDRGCFFASGHKETPTGHKETLRPSAAFWRPEAGIMEK